MSLAQGPNQAYTAFPKRKGYFKIREAATTEQFISPPVSLAIVDNSDSAYLYITPARTRLCYYMGSMNEDGMCSCIMMMMIISLFPIICKTA